MTTKKGFIKGVLLLCLLISVASSGLARGRTLENFDGGGMEMNREKVFAAVLSCFIIGNVVAWSMGAYPRDFPLKPYSEEELRAIEEYQLEMRENPEEPEIKTELGTLYFHHHDMDKADSVLEKAVEQDPRSGEALAVYSSNRAVRAGAMWDFTWGILKLHEMDRAIDGLNRAVKLEPDSFTVRLYRMYTLVGFNNRRESLHWVFEDEEWFLSQDRENATYFPVSVKLEFYKVLSKAYQIQSELEPSEEGRRESRSQSEWYHQKANPPSTRNERRKP